MDDNPSKADRVIRVVIAISFGIIGLTTGLLIVLSGIYSLAFADSSYWIIAGILVVATALMLAIGYLVGPFLLRQSKVLLLWWESRLIKIPVADLIGAVLGLIIGLIIAFFAGSALSVIPIAGRFLPIVASIFLGYLGASLGFKKRAELFLTIGRIGQGQGRDRKKEIQAISTDMGFTESQSEDIPGYIEEGSYLGDSAKILDTSVIIDGRIADVYRTGFLSGTIIVPGFVLTELQRVADSSDVLKRNRGRRGLDILNDMRKEMGERIQVTEASYPDVAEVDAKLVMLAKQIGGDILTNDYNLNKVAELQGIRVLNINDLVNALKQVFLPGEEMTVHVLREGKEQHQGIGYQEDGTMIVVEGGRKYINRTIYTVVTSVLQTSAGRMIFVKPKYTTAQVFADEESR